MERLTACAAPGGTSSDGNRFGRQRTRTPRRRGERAWPLRARQSAEHVDYRRSCSGARSIRERKTADRSNHAVWRVCSSALKSGRRPRRASGMRLSKPCRRRKRETDVFGWFEQGSLRSASSFRTLAAPTRTTARTSKRGVGVNWRRGWNQIVARRFSIKLHLHQDCDQRSRRRGGSNRRAAHFGVAPGEASRSLRSFQAGNRPGRQPRPARMLSPLFLVIAALVKLTSRGPVFFRQERIGQARASVHDAQVPDDAG